MHIQRFRRCDDAWYQINVNYVVGKPTQIYLNVSYSKYKCHRYRASRRFELVTSLIWWQANFDWFVSSLTDDIFVLKYSAYIQTSRSPPQWQWPPVLVGNQGKYLCQYKYWQSNLCEASWKIELQQAVFISDSMFVNITKMIGLRSINLEKSKITDIGVQSMSGRRIVIHARWERMAWRN